MSQGLITLTNGSAAVSGAGTNFGTDNKIGDFIVGYINGQSYSLAIASIESPTALTLTEVFYGPTTASVPWDSVPLRAITAIPYQLGVQHLKTLRLMNLESDNWLQLYTGTGDITVNIPDGRQYHGPSLLKLGAGLDNKADKSALDGKADKTALDAYAKKGANSDITSLTGLTTALGIAYGGTGSPTPFGTAPGTFCQGSDTRLMTVSNKSGGRITSGIDIGGGVSLDGGSKIIVKANERNETGLFNQTAPGGMAVGQLYFNWYDTSITLSAIRGSSAAMSMFALNLNPGYSWQFTNGGVLNAPGPVNPGSDERHKSNIAPVKNALAATMSWRGATYEVKDGAPSVGLIAQDVEKFCPEAISVSERTFKDGTTIEDFKNLNVAGASAAYHTEAIKELFSLLEMALTEPDKCRERIAAIKSLISEKENFTS